MLSDLEAILGVSFRDNLNIEHINLEHRERKKRFRKDGSTLHLNLAEVNPSEREEIVDLISTQFENRGRILRHDEEVETQALESGYSEEYGEVRSYFDGVLSQRYHTILDRSLYLRALIDEQDLSKEEIQEKKGQIARRYGADAIYLSSLTNAGYFDPNGGLRDLYVEMGLNSEYERYKFQPRLEEYVEKRLFCVFVESDDSVTEVVQDVRGGLSKYQREDPIHDWFDIRGIGDGCAEIIDSVMEDLTEEFISIDYDHWRDEDDLWVRIYPRSLPPISK